jgi:glycolate oxidase
MIFFIRPIPVKSRHHRGNISTNAGGMRAVKYGVTLDYVAGLTAVMPDGQVMTFGGKVAKDSSGTASRPYYRLGGHAGYYYRGNLKLLPLPTQTVSCWFPLHHGGSTGYRSGNYQDKSDSYSH